MVLCDERILLGVCCLLFFCVIFLLQSINGSGSENMISGFWTISEQFKTEANIDQMVLYFGEGSGYEYDGYMVMVIDGKTVFNDVIKYRITPHGYFGSDTYTFLTSVDTGVIPRKLTMELSPHTGCMKLKCLGERKMYAILYKDNQMSAKTILNIGQSPLDSSVSQYQKELKDSEDAEDIGPST